MQAFAKKHRPKAEEDWITYQDERFGYKLYYPSAIFEPQEPDGAEDSNENDGSSLVLLSDGDEAKIVTFAAENSDDLTPAEYRDTLLNEFGGYDKLDYQPQGKSWFVLSGYRGDKQPIVIRLLGAFVPKTVEGTIKGLDKTVPVEKEPIFFKKVLRD